MRIQGASWTEQTNILHIRCECGCVFRHRADRTKVRCPNCGAEDNCHRLKGEIVDNSRFTRSPATSRDT